MEQWEEQIDGDILEKYARDLPRLSDNLDESALEELQDDELEEQGVLGGFELGAAIATAEYWEGDDE